MTTYAATAIAMVIFTSLLLFAAGITCHADWLLKPVIGLTLLLYWLLMCARFCIRDISETVLCFMMLLNCFALGLFLGDL